MLSHELEVSLNFAVSEATRRRHPFVTVEHILLALLNNRRSTQALLSCGGNIEDIRSQLEAFFDKHLEGDQLEQGKLPAPTIGFQRVIQRAANQVRSAGGSTIHGTNILISIFEEEDSFAVYFLTKQNITKLDLLQYVSHGVVKEGAYRPQAKETPEGLPGGQQSQNESQKPEGEGGEDHDENRDPLETYAQNLCEKARRGEIDPLIGRGPELKRMMQVLCRRRKNNPLLVGEAGVGKTALAEGLAHKIIAGQVPERLVGKDIYSLDMGALVAGSKFRGEFEQRLKGILAVVRERKNCIIFIDEIHTIVGAGAAGNGSMDASNLLKPALASSELHCIGSTTFKEYRNIFQNDHALTRRFQKIDIMEPSIDECVAILEGLKSHYEEYHNVKYSKEVLRLAVTLSAKYINDRRLPDKAIDVIDEVGASCAFDAIIGKNGRRITVDMVQQTVAKIARIPPAKISSSDKQSLKQIDKLLKSKVFGQDAAIAALSLAIKLSRSGLGDDSKPIGSFLFAGPTGVGKTEVAKQLASCLGIKLLRFDMSEYMERHSVSRLIGSPPGYVGFDQGGLLTDAVTQSPHAVLLLDEIEKAHPDMQNILLQVMDHGSLTDNNGRQADFRNVIIIMTTNAGAQEMSRGRIGLSRSSSQEQEGPSQAVKNQFSPEFRNRLSRIISFQQLPLAVVERVTLKFIDELNEQLREQQVVIHADDQAIKYLTAKGYDPVYGARPMARTIDDLVKQPLVDELLFGKLRKGGTVEFHVKKDQLVFTIAPSKLNKRRPAGKR